MKLNKKVTFFGKQISAVALALIAIAGLASAGLLSYYGMITGTATIEQSVKVDGKSVPASLEIPYDASGVAGSTKVDGPHSLTNDAMVPASVYFNTTCSYVDAGIGEHSCNEISTTYQLVTTLFAKGAWSADFVTGVSHSGDESVRLSLVPDDIVRAKVTGVMIPIAKTTLDKIDHEGLSFWIKGTGTTLPYYQLMIDLGPGAPHGRFAVLPLPTSTPSGDTWAQATVTSDTCSGWFFDGTPLGDVVPDTACADNSCTLSKWHSVLVTAYSSYFVNWVKVQSWGGRGAFTGTETYYIDDIAFKVEEHAVTWDLESDALQSVAVGAWYPDDYMVLPTEGEEYDFTITNEFPLATIPGTYTITTGIVPVT